MNPGDIHLLRVLGTLEPALNNPEFKLPLTWKRLLTLFLPGYSSPQLSLTTEDQPVLAIVSALKVSVYLCQLQNGSISTVNLWSSSTYLCCLLVDLQNCPVHTSCCLVNIPRGLAHLFCHLQFPDHMPEGLFSVCCVFRPSAFSAQTIHHLVSPTYLPWIYILFCFPPHGFHFRSAFLAPTYLQPKLHIPSLQLQIMLHKHCQSIKATLQKIKNGSTE